MLRMNLMTINRLMRLAFLAGALCFSNELYAQVKGLIQIRAVQGDDIRSFQEGGLGLYRHDTKSDELILSQGILDFNVDLASSWSAHGVLNANQDPDVGLGFTQAYIKYQPLSNSNYKWHMRVGGLLPTYVA